MPRRLILLLTLAAVSVSSGLSADAQTQIQIYGSWHCGNDFCTWGSVRDMTDFDTKNHWLIDRGDGSGLPSVNLVVLSFVQPLKLLNKTTDSQTSNGVPLGMNAAVVNYFTSHNIRVMLSIGGITYTSDPTGKAFRSAIDVRIDISHLSADIRETQERVKDAFYANLFLMMAESDRREITAREIDERHESCGTVDHRLGGWRSIPDRNLPKGHQ